jgi:hypothetical protein
MVLCLFYLYLPYSGRTSMAGDFRGNRRASTADLTTADKNTGIKSEDFQSPHFSPKQFPTPKMEPISIDENNKSLKGQENPKSLNREAEKIHRTATISSRPTIRTSTGVSTIDNGSAVSDANPKKAIPSISADASSLKSPTVAPRTPGTRKRNATDMDVNGISPIISATTLSAVQSVRGVRKRVEREEEVVVKEEVKSARRGRPRKTT